MIDISKKASYKTVSAHTESLLTEKRSKFFANVFPVENEEEALEKLAAVKKKYSDATHNVYAYVIDENNIFRYSDDGEPSGTAGMPVLDTIRKEGLVDVLVVVTRYFGGTLLGTGGLVHAYGSSARQGLIDAGIVTRILCNIVEVKIDYNLSGKVQYKIATDNYILEDTVYDNEVTFKICCRIEDTERLIADMIDITNGRARCETAPEPKYIDIGEYGK